MGTFGLSGFGADVATHQRRLQALLERAKRLNGNLMETSTFEDFIRQYGEAMKAYGEALAHAGSVMSNVAQVQEIEESVEYMTRRAIEYPRLAGWLQDFGGRRRSRSR